MSRTTEGLGETLTAYLLEHTAPESEIASRLRLKTAEHPQGMMQISPEQGAFLALLVELIGAKRTVEVGTFTGYSALRTAMALPEDGRMICCDVSDEFTAVGRPFWEEAEVAGKIDLRLAPATETLDKLLAEFGAGSFDLAFIDADKTNYDAYYEAALKLVRKGGLIAIDNVFWSGAVADPNATDDDTMALKALNTKIRSDERVTRAMLPIGDGLTLAIVR